MTQTLPNTDSTTGSTLTNATTSASALSARDLVKVYGRGDAEVRALDGASIDFAPGTFTAIMGPSGSGKSTLMHCLAGLDTPTSGRCFSATPSCHAERAEADAAAARPLRVRVPVVQPRSDADRRGEHRLAARPSPGASPTRPLARHVVDTLGLARPAPHRPAELSGGQQQRVAVARALVARPDVVFADEPTGNLDSRAGAALLAFLREAATDLGQTIVMVTHDPNAASYADEVVFLADGQSRRHAGPPERRSGLGPHDQLDERKGA